MNLSKLNDWLSLVANIGVLLGIFFLASEIQLSNRIGIAQSETAIREGLVSVNSGLYENYDLAALFAEADEIDANYEPNELVALRFLLVNWINTLVAAETAYKNGMISDLTFQAVLNSGPSLVHRYPGLRPIMRGSLVALGFNAGDWEIIDSIDQALVSFGQ